MGRVEEPAREGGQSPSVGPAPAPGNRKPPTQAMVSWLGGPDPEEEAKKQQEEEQTHTGDAAIPPEKREPWLLQIKGKEITLIGRPRKWTATILRALENLVESSRARLPAGCIHCTQGYKHLQEEKDLLQER